MLKNLNEDREDALALCNVAAFGYFLFRLVQVLLPVVPGTGTSRTALQRAGDVCTPVLPVQVALYYR